MSQHFPVLNYKDLTKLAKKCGFYFYREAKGSHEIWWNPKTHKYTTFFSHGKIPLKRRTLKAILKDLGLTVKEARALLNR